MEVLMIMILAKIQCARWSLVENPFASFVPHPKQ
jgi:hypothetical protein